MIKWNVDPEIFHIGSFSVSWYAALFTTAFVLGYFIMKKIFRQEGISVKILVCLTFYIAFGTLIGARFGHCLFYEPEYFLKHPMEMFLPIARDNYGTYKIVGYHGLASHGAAIGILIALYIFSRAERLSYLWILDRIVIVVALSGFFIRIGNLMNSEIFGHPTNLFWGFEFIRSPKWYQHPINSQPCHPTQIYEAIAYLAIFVLLCRRYFKKSEKQYSGILFGMFLVTLFTMRFMIEFLKIEQVPFETGMLLNMGQLLSIPFIFCGIYLLAKYRGKKIFCAIQEKKM